MASLTPVLDKHKIIYKSGRTMTVKEEEKRKENGEYRSRASKKKAEQVGRQARSHKEVKKPRRHKETEDKQKQRT